jgi:hypothetical protein
MRIRNAEELLDKLNVEQANIETYKAELGFGAAEIAECTQDRANLVAAMDNQDIVEADKKMVTKVKNDVFDGDEDKDLSPYPSFTLTPLPHPSIKAGALKRYINRRARARLASGYTEQIGIAMGYEGAPSEPVSDAEIVAALKIADLGGYQYRVEFLKQGKSGMLVQERLRGSESWAKEKTALQSPFTVSVAPPANEGAPVQIEIRGRLLDGNNTVGQWSPIYPLTVNS